MSHTQEMVAYIEVSYMGVPDKQKLVAMPGKTSPGVSTLVSGAPGVCLLHPRGL